MHRLPSGSSVDRRDDPPSLAVSLVLLAVTVGALGLGYAVMTAPTVVAAFGAGILTGAVVTVVHRVHIEGRDLRSLADRRFS